MIDTHVVLRDKREERLEGSLELLAESDSHGRDEVAGGPDQDTLELSRILRRLLRLILVRVGLAVRLLLEDDNGYLAELLLI